MIKVFEQFISTLGANIILQPGACVEGCELLR